MQLVHKTFSQKDQWDITGNIYKTLNIIKQCTSNKQCLLLLSLDIEKAFDSLDITDLLSLLSQMNFGSNIQRAISALYCDPTVSVKVNSLCSDPLRLMKGTRQGCPRLLSYSPWRWSHQHHLFTTIQASRASKLKAQNLN